MLEPEDYDGKTLIYWVHHPEEIERKKLIRLTNMYHLLSSVTDNPLSPVHRYLYALEIECQQRGIHLQLD